MFVIIFILVCRISFANELKIENADPVALQSTLTQQIAELGDTNSEVLATMLKIVSAYRNGGQYSEAAIWSDKVLATCQHIFGENHSFTKACMTSLAVDYRNIGRYAAALAFDEEVLNWRLKNLGEKHLDTLHSYNNVAVDYRRLGKYSEAEEIDQKTLQLRLEILGESNPDTLISMNNLAADYRKLGKYEDALKLDEQVLAVREKILEKDQLILTSINNLASDYAALSRNAEAVALHQKAVEISKKLLGEKHPQTLLTMNNLALDYSRLGRYAEAIPLMERIVKSRTELFGVKNSETLVSMNNLAGDYYTQGRYEEAALQLQLLIDGVEELRRAGDLSPENRQSLFAQWIPSYKNFSLLSFEQQKYDKAFYLSEMTKARTLLELTANRLADNSNLLSNEEARQMEEYQGKLAMYNEEISSSFANIDKKLKIEAAKREVLQEYGQYREAIMNKYPKYKQLSEVIVADAATGAKLLPEDAVFISYMVTTDNKVLVFVIDKLAGLKTISLGEINNLEQMVDAYHTLLSYRDIAQLRESGKYLWTYPSGMFLVKAGMSKPDEHAIIVKDNKVFYDAVNQLARMLGEKLLLPIMAELKGKKQWIISTDGILSVLPFETLVVAEKPVIMERDISYIQSLSMLSLLQQRGDEPRKENEEKTLFAMGAAYYQGESNLSKVHLRAGLNDLKSSELELDALAQVFAGSKLAIYKKADSTEAKLMELNQNHELAKYKYIVFSAHGYFDDKQPSLNSIVLGQKNLVSGTDGFITVNKWPSYDLNSNLVYLSACETGRGQFVPGEGVLGLTYSLFVAGNKNTIATLWKTMDDQSAVQFTQSFFTKVQGGMSQTQALSQTKRDFIVGDKYNRPIYWAPFVLYGI